MSTLKLGTRGSPLALWQAHFIESKLAPFVDSCEVVRIESDGDRDQASALSAMGGFGVFTKAIQNALLANRADLAVHSLKDLPTVETEGVELIAVPERGPTGDALVSRKWKCFDDLPRGAKIGTSSLRRRAQLLNRRPDLKLLDLRGNVDTRLRKLDDLDLDAIVLAEAGLVRLGLRDRINEVLDCEWMLPAVGQGAIGLECRTEDRATRRIAEELIDPSTWARVRAERAMLSALGGGCLIPIGATSKEQNGIIALRGAVLNTDGSRRVVATLQGPSSAPLALGQELAARLLDEGAGELLSG